MQLPIVSSENFSRVLQFLKTEHFRSATFQNIRDFKIQRRGRQGERQKNNWVNKQSNNFAPVHHAFLHISFLFLHDYDVKMPNFAFYRGRKQATTKLYFCFYVSLWTLEIQLQEGSPTFDKVSGYE